MATQKLTTLKVRHATAPGRYGDGNGLYLYVRPNGSRAWVLRYKRAGEKTRDMGLGSLANVSLAEARELASQAREKIRAGKDPIVARGAPVVEPTVDRTFRGVAEEYVRSQEVGWKNPIHRAQWRSTLVRYAFPALGDMPVDTITTADIRAVLSPIETQRRRPRTGCAAGSSAFSRAPRRSAYEPAKTRLPGKKTWRTFCLPPPN